MLCWQFLFPCALNWSLWRRLWILSCVRSMGRKCWECRGMTMRLLLFMMNSSHMRVPSLLHHLLRLMRSLLWITTRYVFPPPCLSYSTSTSCFVYFLVTLTLEHLLVQFKHSRHEVLSFVSTFFLFLPSVWHVPAYVFCQDAYRLQLKLFLYEVKQQQLLSGVRTFLKVYSTISVGKLATYMEVDEPTLRSEITRILV